MPVLAVPRYRCKTCFDVGFVVQRVVNEKHPHLARPVSEQDPRTGLQLNAGLPVAPGRWLTVQVPCLDCPPETVDRYVRDWERP